MIRLKEEPVFCWVPLNANRQPLVEQTKQEILSGMRIILAQAEVLNCKLNDDVSIAQRLNARPAKQPYICCGDVTPKWETWELTPFDSSNVFTTGSRVIGQNQLVAPIILPIGLQAKIDTSECGFLTTPCYTARISGLRVHQIDLPAAAGATGQKLTVVVDGLTQIIQPSPVDFVINVLLMFQILSPANAFRTSAGVSTSGGGSGSGSPEDQLKQFISEKLKDWSVEWMGVEG